MRTSKSKHYSASTFTYNALIPHAPSAEADKQDRFPDGKWNLARERNYEESSNNDGYTKWASQHPFNLSTPIKHTAEKRYFEPPDRISSNKSKDLTEIVHSLSSSNFKKVEDFNSKTTDLTLHQILNQAGTAVITQTKRLAQNLVELFG